MGVISNYMEEMQGKVFELEDEISALKDQLRWRKYPREKPEKEGYYMCVPNPNIPYPAFRYWEILKTKSRWRRSASYKCEPEVTYWLPIPEIKG